MESRFDVLGKILTVKDRDEIYDPGIELNYFTGLGSIEDFVEWVRQVDKISDYTGWSETKVFKIAAIKLTKNAGLWFDNLNTSRARSGKEKIMTWMTLKKKLRAKYIPYDYELEKFLKLTSLSQGTMSVSEYTSEFEKLCFICDLEEEETKKIARFIRGLNWPIYKKVKSSPYISFNDVRNLAFEFESHQPEEQEEKLKSSFQWFELSRGTQKEEVVLMENDAKEEEDDVMENDAKEEEIAITENDAKKEEIVIMENVVDLIVDCRVLHVETTQNSAETKELVTKQAIIEKHEEYEHVLIIEENHVSEPLQVICSDIKEKDEVENVIAIVNVVKDENNIITMEHIDFLGIDNLLETPGSSIYLVLFRLLPKILVMGLKFDAFEFYKKLSRCVLILKYFKTWGRVFFKGEENDEDQGMDMLIGKYLLLLFIERFELEFVQEFGQEVYLDKKESR